MNTKPFISEQLFNHLTKVPAKWKDLQENVIYKVEDFNDSNNIATLVNNYGDRTLILIPDSVAKKIVLDKDSAVYLKKYGNDACLTTLNHHACQNCGKTYASKRTLNAHKNHHCRGVNEDNWYKPPALNYTN